jgi:NTE family protein
LAKINAFSCVSGGSIIGGYLAHLINNGMHVVDGRYVELDAALEPFFQFMRRDIRTLSTLARLKLWEPPGSAPRTLERYYEDLVGKTRLAELEPAPRFIFCATNLFFANSWVCERKRVGDYMSGYVEPPPADWTLARAISLSSCFPPVFDPARAGLDPEKYSPPTSPDGQRQAALSQEELRRLKEARKLTELTDGGVYDNLGLEPVWKSCETILVSDGGKPMQHKFVPPGLRLMRYQQVIQNQVLALRKRWLIDTFERAKRGVDQDTFNGTYWGIMSATTRYDKNATFGYSKGLAAQVANVRTDLNPFSPNEIAVLEKHGYELADIAVRTHAAKLATFPDTPRKLRSEKPKLLDEAKVAQALSWSGSRVLSTLTARSSSLIQ